MRTKERANMDARRAGVWGIVGWRNFDGVNLFNQVISELVATRGRPKGIVSGGAAGADWLAEQWASNNGVPITVHRPASGARSAYLARNDLIVRDADIIIAFLSTQSVGTVYTINKAKRAGKEVVVIKVD